MARPKSTEKQIALLEAAAMVVAAQGLGASTALIAKSAGVAEGTLFRYFVTKDDLLNELYLHIKRSLCEAMKINFPRTASLEEQLRALWNGYIDWGVANPAAIKALNQLAVSDKITAETRTRAYELFPEIQEISSACVAKGAFSKLPAAFADAIFMGLADAAMQFAAREPEQADAFKATGFKVLWEGFTS